MSRAMDEIRSRIKVAIAEVDAEHRRLSGALASIDGPKSPSRRTTGRKGSRRRSSRASRGQRRQQFLGAVREQPGITVSEVAKKIGLSAPNALYPLAKKLVNEKALTKKGSGYAIKAADPVKRTTKARRKVKKASN